MKSVFLYLFLLLTGCCKAVAQDLQATVLSNHIALQWKLLQNRQADHCEVQRRSRGTEFRTIALVLADNTNDSAVYNFKDKLLGSESFFYYRIRTVYSSGEQQFSEILPVPVYPGEQEQLAITLLSQTAVQIKLPPANTSYLLRLYTAEGQLLGTRRSSAGTCNWPVKKLKPGVYFVEAYLPINGRRYYGSFRK